MLLPLVTDQLSGQLDDHSSKPDHEACAQLLSTVLDNLDRKDVVRSVWTRRGYILQITDKKKHLLGIKEAEMSFPPHDVSGPPLRELRHQWRLLSETAGVLH